MGLNVGIAFKTSLNVVQVLAELIVVNVVNIVHGPKSVQNRVSGRNFCSRRLWRRIEPPKKHPTHHKKNVYRLLKDGGRFWERRDQPNW